jgi:hypothetical protein
VDPEGLTDLPPAALMAVILLGASWSVVRMGTAAFAYWSDPDRGGIVFYTRGLFGGYTLWLGDYETLGLWAGFPIATAVAWLVARGVAWVPFHFWDWSYGLVFAVVVTIVTLPIMVGYVGFTYEETETSWLED